MLCGFRTPTVSPWLLVSLSLTVACSEGSPQNQQSGGAPGTGGSLAPTGGAAPNPSGGAQPSGGTDQSQGGSPQSSAGTTQGGSGGATAGEAGMSQGGTGGAQGGEAGTPQGGGGATGGEGGSGGAVGGSAGAGGSGGRPPSDCKPNGRARNPLISHIFTADPNAVVYGDRIYVYTSHDVDGQDDYKMVDYHVFSSDDMVNWQDHGAIIHANELSWANYLYAPGACTKNGKYYLYIPNEGSSIGVAVADHPGGPFVDPIKKALVTKSFPNANVPWLFDPACFVDDDGQGYLYFGGGDDGGQNARVVRLNDDMTSIKDSMATTIPTTAFFEASFMHKHDGKYYFSYSADFSSGHGAALEYLIGTSPMSGFEYQGKILNNGNINNGNNNHGSIVEFAGKTYLFYHNRKLQQELGVNKVNNRSIAVQELTYGADGKINTISMSTEDYTVSQIKCLDAFEEVEAERFAEEKGIEVDGKAGGVVRVAQIDTGDWIAYSQVDFRDGATSVVLKVASASGGGQIEFVIDGCIAGKTGTSVGTCEVKSTGGANMYAPLTCTITNTSGAHDLCFKFTGNRAFEIDSFHLE